MIQVIPAILLSIFSQPLHSLPSANNFSIKDRLSTVGSPTITQPLSVVKDEFGLLRNERIGNLQIGLSEAKVKQRIDCALKREPEKLWGADGAYHQIWKYADCGITLSMVSEKKGAPKSIESITLNSPSRLSTKRNIQVGSPQKAVMKAYKSEWNRETSGAVGVGEAFASAKASARRNLFVAGSIYGGLIFQFQNGKVSLIFLGAAAE